MPTENNATSVLDGDELDAALKQSLKESAATYVHRLREPFTYEGSTWENLTFHFGRLTGRDSLTIENEMALEGKALVAAEFSGEAASQGSSGPAPVRLHQDHRAGPVFFAQVGAVGGQELRRQCLILSQNNHTPVSFWMELPFLELREWRRANNAVVEEAAARIEEMRNGGKERL